MILKKIFYFSISATLVTVFFLNTSSNSIFIRNNNKYYLEPKATWIVDMKHNLNGSSSFKPGDVIKDDTVTFINGNNYDVDYSIGVTVEHGAFVKQDHLNNKIKLVIYNENGEILGKLENGAGNPEEIIVNVEANSEYQIYPVVSWVNDNDVENIKVSGRSLIYKYEISAEGNEYTDEVYIVGNPNGVDGEWVKHFDSLNEAIEKARDYTEIRIYPGDYNLDISEYSNKLILDKSNMKIIGCDSKGQPVINPSSSKVNIIWQNTAGQELEDENPVIEIKGENIILAGLNVYGNSSNDYKVIEVNSNNVCINNCNISGNILFDANGEENINRFTIEKNIIQGEIYITNGTGAQGDKSERKIVNNTLKHGATKGAIFYIGIITEEYDSFKVGEAEIKSNIFIGDTYHVRAMGTLVGKAESIVLNVSNESSNIFRDSSNKIRQVTRGQYTNNGEKVYFIENNRF